MIQNNNFRYEENKLPQIYERIDIYKKQGLISENSSIFKYFSSKQSESMDTNQDIQTINIDFEKEIQKPSKILVDQKNFEKSFLLLLKNKENSNQQELESILSNYFFSHFEKQEKDENLDSFLIENFLEFAKSDCSSFVGKLENPFISFLFKFVSQSQKNQDKFSDLVDLTLRFLFSSNHNNEKQFKLINNLLHSTLNDKYYGLIQKIYQNENFFSVSDNIDSFLFKISESNNFKLIPQMIEQICLKISFNFLANNEWEKLTEFVLKISKKNQFFESFFERLMIKIISESNEKLDQQEKMKFSSRLFVECEDKFISGLFFDWTNVCLPNLNSKIVISNTFESKKRPRRTSSKKNDDMQISEEEEEKNNSQPEKEETKRLMTLSSMIERSSWQELDKNMSWIFSNQSKNLNVESCLDFVHSFLFHPRALIGFIDKEDSSVKIDSCGVDPIFHFDPFSTCKLADMVIHDTKNFLSRFPLILFACKQSEQNLQALLVYLLTLFDSQKIPTIRLDLNNFSENENESLYFTEKENNEKKKISAKFSSTQLLFFHLYLHFPNSVKPINPGYKPDPILFQINQSHSHFTFQIHHILKKLKSENTVFPYILARKYSTLFPHSVLYFLSTIAALLKGTKMNDEIEDFVSIQNSSLLVKVIALLESLSPHIFSHHHLPLLHSILSSFFNLFDSLTLLNYDMIGFFTKFVDFLFLYLQNVENPFLFFTQKIISSL